MSVIELILAVAGGGIGAKIIDWLIFRYKHDDDSLRHDIKTLLDRYKTDNEALRKREQQHLTDKDELRQKMTEFFEREMKLTAEIQSLKSVIDSLKERIDYLTTEYDKRHKK